MEGILSPKDVAHYPDTVVRDRAKRQEVMLEYPSGIRLSVDASNLSLIAELVKLWVGFAHSVHKYCIVIAVFFRYFTNN